MEKDITLLFIRTSLNLRTRKLTLVQNHQITIQLSKQAQVLHAASSNDLIRSRILLATAQVNIVALNGSSTLAKALVDQGSEITLTSERIAQRLKLPRIRSSIPLVGVGAQISSRTRGAVHFKLKPHFSSNFETSITAHVLTKLTGTIPSMQIPQHSWPYLEELQLADPNYSTPGSIDLIIGTDVYGQIINEGFVKDQRDSPIAQCTSLGWIISGPSGSNASVELHHIISLFMMIFTL